VILVDSAGLVEKAAMVARQMEDLEVWAVMAAMLALLATAATAAQQTVDIVVLTVSD
jgi:hypothetical protein